MRTSEEIQALIDEQHEREQTLRGDLDDLSEKIADALVEGKATKALHNKQASARADLEVIPSVIKRLEQHLIDAQTREHVARIVELRATRREQDKIENELSDQISSLKAQIAKLTPGYKEASRKAHWTRQAENEIRGKIPLSEAEIDQLIEEASE